MKKRWKLVAFVLGLTAFGVLVARMSNSVHVLAQQTAYTQTTHRRWKWRESVALTVLPRAPWSPRLSG